jgi:drug/metabolite transporter (DMT)-like permease
MLNTILYLACTLIWGSTWLAIKLQLTQVPPVLSVGYRFCLASLVLFSYCILTRKKLRFSLYEQKFMLLQGVTLFSLGYCGSYLSTVYLTSGLVAVVFSILMMWNILNLKLFMGQPVQRRAFVGGLIGLTGICILFWQDLSSLAATRGLIGLVLGLSGAYLASIGNIIGSRNAKHGIPVTQANAFGMAYGGIATLCIHLASGGGWVMDWTWGYLGPMLYLTLFGSVAAFGCYMLLIGRIGAEYAAYVMLLVPVLALVLSTLFEHYLWTASGFAGVFLVIIGNLVMLTRRETARHLLQRISVPGDA